MQQKTLIKIALGIGLLKDGSTLYIFKDGKMSMENKLSHIVGMKNGVVMETKDGQI